MMNVDRIMDIDIFQFKPCICKCGRMIIRKSEEGFYRWHKHVYFSHKCKNKGATRKARRNREHSASKVIRRRVAVTGGFIQDWLCGKFDVQKG